MGDGAPLQPFTTTTNDSTAALEQSDMVTAITTGASVLTLEETALEAKADSGSIRETQPVASSSNIPACVRPVGELYTFVLTAHRTSPGQFVYDPERQCSR
ncbi:hypothetical protein EXIGLDRAFT_768506 [Exidia glandulosa HHB12029]|uniref:Uncharacterized protein n=1 Tax=Exidia glandulosa HHB12029 TaxID=1314781 RepID=A0A165I6I2_EXIGL|nr:hypothetical protein EXIGLDRAFT_768506 [Exidia glandulosa HHB12029]